MSKASPSPAFLASLVELSLAPRPLATARPPHTLLERKQEESSDQLDWVNTSKEDLGRDKGCYRLKWCGGRVRKRQRLGWDQHDAQQGHQSNLARVEMGFVCFVV